MAGEIVFNPVDLQAYVNACNFEGQLRNLGASLVDIKAAQMDILTRMVILLSPHMTPTDMSTVILTCLLACATSLDNYTQYDSESYEDNEIAD